MLMHEILQKFFAPWLTPWESFKAQIVLICLALGQKLSSEQMLIYRRYTNRVTIPSLLRRIYWISPRRTFKTGTAIIICLLLALFRDWAKELRPAETGVILLIAPDRSQSSYAFKLLNGIINVVSAFSSKVVRITKDSVEFENRILIRVATASSVSTRGFKLVGCVIDEAAHLPKDESAEPDVELLRALLPALADTPGSLLLVITTPRERRGIVFDGYRDFYGVEDESVVFWKGDLDMNPALDRRIVEESFRNDPVAAKTEWCAEFRADLASYVDRVTVEAVTADVSEYLPRSFSSVPIFFCDMAGGSGSDSATLSGSVCDKDGIIKQVIQKEFRPPFNPEEVIRDFSSEIKRWAGRQVTGDRYAGDFPKVAFERYGISYRQSEKTKSELFQEFLKLINSGKVELLRNPRLLHQLCALERRIAPSGREFIESAPRTNDDLANSCAGSCVLAAAEGNREAFMSAPLIHGPQRELAKLLFHDTSGDSKYRGQRPENRSDRRFAEAYKNFGRARVR